MTLTLSPDPKMPLTPLPKPQRMSYRIGRGETGVLTFEPYKSILLPLWRFKTPTIALQSSSALYMQFLAYKETDDFIGMDMTRKFLQMGMTRAARYANYKGGRKYDAGRVQREKSRGHEGKEGKEEASRIFRGVWERAKGDEGYLKAKERFMKEQKEWDKEQRRMVKTEDGNVDQEVKAKIVGRKGQGHVKKEPDT